MGGLTRDLADGQDVGKGISGEIVTGDQDAIPLRLVVRELFRPPRHGSPQGVVMGEVVEVPPGECDPSQGCTMTGNIASRGRRRRSSERRHRPPDAAPMDGAASRWVSCSGDLIAVPLPAPPPAGVDQATLRYSRFRNAALDPSSSILSPWGPGSVFCADLATGSRAETRRSRTTRARGGSRFSVSLGVLRVSARGGIIRKRDGGLAAPRRTGGRGTTPSVGVDHGPARPCSARPRTSRCPRRAYPRSRSRSSQPARVPIVAVSSSSPARSSCAMRRAN